MSGNINKMESQEYAKVLEECRANPLSFVKIDHPKKRFGHMQPKTLYIYPTAYSISDLRRSLFFQRWLLLRLKSNAFSLA